MIATGALLVSVVGLIPLYADYLQRRRDREPPFILQRFQETVSKPVESEWSIRILRPTKTIERCKILYRNYPCPWWDSDKDYYERLIKKGGSGNVRIPKTPEEWNYEVIVKDGDRTLGRVLLHDIPKALR